MCFLVELFFLIDFLHEVPPGFKCQENSPSKLSKEKYNTLYYLGSQLCTQQAWIESKISILELSLVYSRNAFLCFRRNRKQPFIFSAETDTETNVSLSNSVDEFRQIWMSVKSVSKIQSIIFLNKGYTFMCMSVIPFALLLFAQ